MWSSLLPCAAARSARVREQSRGAPGAGRGGSVSRWFGDVGERDGATPASERPRGRSVLAGHGGNDARHVWMGPGGGGRIRG